MTENDDELDDNALSDIYTQFSREEPSDELDDRVLSAAKKAVGSEQAAAKKVTGPFSGQWRVPASLAAVIVLSVIVVVTIEREHFDTLTSAPEQAIVQPEAPPTADRHEASSADAALAPKEDSTAQAARKPAPAAEQGAAAVAKEAPELTEKKQQSAHPVFRSRVVPQQSVKPAPPAKSPKQPASPVGGSSAPPASDAGVDTASKPSKDVKQQHAPVFFSSAGNRKMADAKPQAGKQKKSVSSSGLPATRLMLAPPAPEARREEQSGSEQLDSEQAPREAIAEAPASAPRSVKSDATPTAKTDVTQATGEAPVAAAEPGVADAGTAADAAAAPARSEAQAATQDEADRSTATRLQAEAQANAADEAPKESAATADQPALKRQSAAIAAVQAEAKPKPKSNLSKQEQASTQGDAALSSESTAKPQSSQQLSSAAGAVAAVPQDSDTKMQASTTQSASTDETPCERFSELACYVSDRCILQWREEQKSYNCRDADNECEQGFSQANSNRQDCENNPACVYAPANCYCAPNAKCDCEGGPPAMCSTKKQP